MRQQPPPSLRPVPDDPGPGLRPTGETDRPRGLRAWTRRARPVTETGDDLVIAELYHAYHRPLLSFVLRLVGGDRSWAEDVVQETMIRAWNSIDRLDVDGDSLMPWLATVARRIVIDDRRRRAA